MINTPLWINFSLSGLHTDYSAHKTLLGFLDSPQNLGLYHILIIISINDFVDIEWDSVKMETMVCIHSFGILTKFDYPRINGQNICFFGCLDRQNSCEWTGTWNEYGYHVCVIYGYIVNSPIC
jgi:hypothetical protein